MDNEKRIDENLIEEVRQHKCLYNLVDPNYKNILYKDKVWATIAQRLNVNAEQCKRKWKSLRDMKRRNHKLLRLASGSAASTHPRRQWMHADAMAFLDDSKCYRSTIGSLQQPGVVEEQPSRSSNQAKFSPPVAPNSASPDLWQEVLVTDPLASPSPSPSLPPSPSPAFTTDWKHRSIRRQEKENAEIDRLLNAATGTINGLTNTLYEFSARKSTATKLYFAAMAEELEQADLPPVLLRSATDECRRIIYNIIDSYKSKNNM